MTDQRPANCRFRLMAEKKPHPRSGCAGCGKSLLTGLGNMCHVAAAPARTPPKLGEYSNAAVRLESMYRKEMPNVYYPVFLHALMKDGITAEQAREAAHLLNQIAEYLDG